MKTTEEWEAQFDRIEALLKQLSERPVAAPPAGNPMDAIGKLLGSELIQDVQKKATDYEQFSKEALRDIYKTIDRVEQKLNLLSSALLGKT